MLQISTFQLNIVYVSVWYKYKTYFKSAYHRENSYTSWTRVTCSPLNSLVVEARLPNLNRLPSWRQVYSDNSNLPCKITYRCPSRNDHSTGIWLSESNKNIKQITVFFVHYFARTSVRKKVGRFRFPLEFPLFSWGFAMNVQRSAQLSPDCFRHVKQLINNVLSR